MDSDNSLAQHVAKDFVSPEPRSNNMLASNYAGLWFERGYVPEGDILDWVGVDVSSDTKATDARWQKYDHMEESLKQRPSYYDYIKWRPSFVPNNLAQADVGQGRSG